MADIFSKEKRSSIMASVRNLDTVPEVQVRKALFHLGFRYRKNDKHLPGSPDIVLPKYRTVIFIHGCFWHGHQNCKKNINPNTNQRFWFTKINKNKLRDKEVRNKLLELDWNVLTIWQCELRNKKFFESTISRILSELESAQ